MGGEFRVGMGAELPTLEPFSQSHGIPIAPVVEAEVAKGPDDPSRWILNTVEDLGILSARTLQGLTNPENIALMGLMATGNEEAVLPKLANAGFSLEMARNGYRDVKAGIEAAKKGNLREAGRLFGSGAANALLIGLANRKKPSEKAEEPKSKTPSIIKAVPEPPTPEEFADKRPPMPPEIESIMAGVASQPRTELLQSVPEAPEVPTSSPQAVEEDRKEKLASPSEPPEAAAVPSPSAPPGAPPLELTPPSAPAKAPETGPPQADPGWKLSLASYSAEKARAFAKRHAGTFDHWKLVDDPQSKGRYYVSYQPKTASAQTTTAKSVPSAPPLPEGEPTSPEGMRAEADWLRDNVTSGRIPAGQPSRQAIQRAIDLEQRAAKITPESPKAAEAAPESKDAEIVPPTPQSAAPPPEPDIYLENPEVERPTEPWTADNARKRLLAGEQPPYGTVFDMDRRDITSRPSLMQFRTELGKIGRAVARGEIKTYNPLFADRSLVWWNPKTEEALVVDGHHRHQIAETTNQPTEKVEFIRAKDVKAARAIGAMKNIAEGNATAIDAAKFFRDTGRSPDELAMEGLALSSSVSRDGLALANLSDRIFDKVARGDLSEYVGVAIGGNLKDPLQQEGLLQLVQQSKKSGRSLTQDEISSLARRAASSGKTTKQGEGLFGGEEEQSNAVEEAAMESYIRKRITRDRRLFGFVGKEARAAELKRAGNLIDVERSRGIADQSSQMEDYYDKLLYRVGPVEEAIKNGAARIQQGEDPERVREESYSAVAEAVRRTLGGGVEAGGD